MATFGASGEKPGYGQEDAAPSPVRITISAGSPDPLRAIASQRVREPLPPPLQASDETQKLNGHVAAEPASSTEPGQYDMGLMQNSESEDVFRRMSNHSDTGVTHR